MLKLSLTLMNMKSGATHLSILLLETAACKMRNRNVCTNSCLYDGPCVKGGTQNLDEYRSIYIIYLPVCLSVFLSIKLYIYLLSINLSIFLSVRALDK